MNIHPVIVIDSREPEPFVFENPPSVEGSLATGDYSIDGLTHLITLERKSLPDLLACCGRERDRFKRELQRMMAYRFRMLVVEADALTLETGEWRSKLQPSHVLGSLSAWTAQFGLPVWLGGDHESCARFVEKYLYQCARCVASEYTAASALIETAKNGETVRAL